MGWETAATAPRGSEKPVCTASNCSGTSMPRSKHAGPGKRLRRGGGSSRPPAPVNLPVDGKVAVDTPDGAPGSVGRPTQDLLQVLGPLGFDTLPLGAVPCSPEVASVDRCQDVANRGLGHVPAAVAEEGGWADPVVRGDGAERVGLQQLSLDGRAVRVRAGGTGAHQQIINQGMASAVRGTSTRRSWGRRGTSSRFACRRPSAPCWHAVLSLSAPRPPRVRAGVAGRVSRSASR